MSGIGRGRAVRAGLLLAATAAATGVGVSSAAAADLPVPVRVVEGPIERKDGYSVQPLMFTVRVGVGDVQTCQLEAELFRPSSATAARPAPAIMITNGFGGNVAGERSQAAGLARKGYVTLPYSGLGWGNSGCKITLDDPDYDGRAASALLSYLGGARVPGGRPVDFVRRDQKAHDGTVRPNDPRSGMIGGSYGGQIQFATAGVDPRLDTIVPQNTWNDLRYALAPNNADLRPGVQSAEPGALKLLWSLGFFTMGLVNGVNGLTVDPGQRALVCPGFDLQLCAAAGAALVQGYPPTGLARILRHASVADYVQRIRIPTLLAQGQEDSLFNLQESVATYDALRAQGVPVKLIWHHAGHSGGRVPGEQDVSFRTPAYESTAFLDWFAHWLKDDPKVPSLDFSYFREWAPYRGDATPAYARSASFPPPGRTAAYSLSADGTLQPEGAPTKTGDPSFLTTVAGLPTGLTTFSLFELGSQPVDLPGTSTSFTSAPLTADTDVVGIPTVRLRINPGLAGVTGALLGELGQAVVFVRLEDLHPDGTVELPAEQTAPVRVPTDGRPITVSLPGIVHRFPRGHRFRLVVAGGDLAFRGSTVPTPVSISLQPGVPSPLRIPVVPLADQRPTVRAALPTAPGAAASRARPRVTRIRLAARRLSLRVSSPATVRVAIARRGVRRVRSGGRVRTRTSWRTVRRLSATAPRRATTIRRTLRRLPAGRYRVTVRATGRTSGRTRTVQAQRTVRR
ncbi:CocE/NonD family hydrolase [Patulibacter defluvii]|uniref:CocE/NonD family hydrolase n=1 Tax=Patulibacter defluvii TaxID=3095358 RepID=UPI002A74C4D6|nr:CocE/NonD family hydrolase [Patulibacter sp. DM4]